MAVITGEIHNQGGGGWFSTDAYLTSAERGGTADAGAPLSLLMTITMPAGTGGVLVATGTYRIDANLALGKELSFTEGAILKPASGVTVTVEHRPRAGRYRIFDLSLGGIIRFASGAADDVFPEWFGAVGTGVVVCGAQVQDAIDALPQTGGRVHFSVGIYLLATTAAGAGLVIPHDRGTVTLAGAGMGEVNTAYTSRNTTTLRYAKKTGVAVQVGSTSTGQFTSSHRVEHLRVDLWDGTSGTWTGSSAVGIAIYKSRFIKLTDVMVSTLQKSGQATGETGILSDGQDDFCGWGEFVGVYVRGNFTTGVRVTGNAGKAGGGHIRWYGGAVHWLPATNGQRVSGTRGLWLERGGGNTFFGCDFDGWTTAVDVDAAGGNIIIGRWEGGGNDIDIDQGPGSTVGQNLYFGYDPDRVVDTSGLAQTFLDPQRFGVSKSGQLSLGLGSGIPGAHSLIEGTYSGNTEVLFKTVTESYVRFMLENPTRAWGLRNVSSGLLQVWDESAGNVALTWDSNRSTRLGGRLRYAAPAPFAAGDTTPSILGGNVFTCANASATSITGFDTPSAADLMEGQPIHVLLDANTTIVHNASAIVTRDGANIVGSAHVGTALMLRSFLRVSSVWYEM